MSKVGFWIKGVCIICIMVIFLSGCRKEMTKDSETMERQGKTAGQEKTDQEEQEISDKETFAVKLKKLDLGQNELLICVDADYSDSSVEQLNELLKKQGYKFQVKFCRIPDYYTTNSTAIELMEFLKENNINVDLMPLWRQGFQIAQEHGLLYDISDFMDTEEGKKLKKAVAEDFWNLTVSEGKYFGIGNVYAPGTKGWAVNTELMEKYGYSREDLAKPLWELEDVLKQVKEENPGIVPFIFSADQLLEGLPFCYAVDINLPIGIWRDKFSENLQAENIFGTEEMKKWVETFNDFYQKGYIAEYGNVSGADSFFMQMEYSDMYSRRLDEQDHWSNTAGVNLTRISFYDKYTTDLSVHINVVPAWSVHKDDAVSFLSFLFQNQEASQLLFYGIEGVDYKKKDGMCQAGDNFSEINLYNRSLGNWNICSPLAPYEDEGKLKVDGEKLEEVKENPLFRFVFDESVVQKEVNAVKELYSHIDMIRNIFIFEKSSDTGNAENWQDYYEYYQNELKSAGIEKVVDEMNRQIQEYLKD